MLDASVLTTERRAVTDLQPGDLYLWASAGRFEMREVVVVVKRLPGDGAQLHVSRPDGVVVTADIYGRVSAAVQS